MIKRAVEDVFAFITNIEAQTQWQAATLENRKLTEGPVRVGTRMQHHGKFMRVRIETIAEVIELEPYSRYRYKSIQGFLPVDMLYALEPLKGGTKLNLTAGGAPGGFFRLAEPLVAVASRRLISADLRRLKGVLEAQDKS